MGRPSKINDEIKIKHLIIKLVEKGLPVKDIADVLNINRDTIYEWAKNDREFSDTLKAEKENTIQTELKKKISGKTLAMILIRNAKGHHGTSQRIIYDKNNEVLQTVKTKQYYPPSQSSIDKLIELFSSGLYEDEKTLTINLIRGQNEN